MKIAVLFLCLSVALACAQNINVQVGGKPVGSGSTLNFTSGDGIIQSCYPDGARITCRASYDSAVLASREIIHGTHNYCLSATKSTSYECRISNSSLTSYSAGLTFVLMVDVPCTAQCSLNIDGLGPVSIKRSDGAADPSGTLAPGQPQWVFYDGKVFRLMGGGGGGGSRVTDDRDRDVLGRRFIAGMDSMAYAKAVSLETTGGDVHKTITSNAVGNAIINATTAGLPGQHMWVIVVNDQLSGKTVSFGNNFKSAGPLAGSPGKSATLQFISDGTAWYEVARTGNL